MTKIFIDPGHNPTGNDTGAVGYGALEEAGCYCRNSIKIKTFA